MTVSSTSPTVATFAGTTPATLFRRYSADGSSSPCMVREERLIDSTLHRLVGCLSDSGAYGDGDYFLATDDGDLERDVVLAMQARGEFEPVPLRIP